MGQGAPVRVVVLTASFGAGHDGPAREIAQRLVATGHQADLVDLVELAPARTGRLMTAQPMPFPLPLRGLCNSWCR